MFNIRAEWIVQNFSDKNFPEGSNKRVVLILKLVIVYLESKLNKRLVDGSNFVNS